jgi:nitroreductase
MKQDVRPMSLEEAILGRTSVRAFRPDPVPRELIEDILRRAARAPSGTNVQPWKIHVVAGEVRRELEREVLAHRENDPPTMGPSSRAPASARSPTSRACANSARTCTP